MRRLSRGKVSKPFKNKDKKFCGFAFLETVCLLHGLPFSFNILLFLVTLEFCIFLPQLSTKHGKTSEAINKADREYFKAVKTAEQTRFQRIITMNHTAFALQNSESAYMEEIKKIIIKFVDVLGQIIPLIRGVS